MKLACHGRASRHGVRAMEEALWETPLLRQLAGISLDFEGVPDETTILKFRHLLEKHELSKALFDEMTAVLTERGLLLRQGTIVDATLIAAPPSTRNAAKSRDPEMKQTKKVSNERSLEADRAERRCRPGHALQAQEGPGPDHEKRRINRLTSGFRSTVEHVFRVVRRQFGYTRTRYRGLSKTARYRRK